MEMVNQMRYPPHTAEKLRWARVFLLKQVNLAKWRQMAQVAMFAALAAFVVKVRCCLKDVPEMNWIIIECSYFKVDIQYLSVNSLFGQNPYQETFI